MIIMIITMGIYSVQLEQALRAYTFFKCTFSRLSAYHTHAHAHTHTPPKSIY